MTSSLSHLAGIATVFSAVLMGVSDFEGGRGVLAIWGISLLRRAPQHSLSPGGEDMRP